MWLNKPSAEINTRTHTSTTLTPGEYESCRGPWLSRSWKSLSLNPTRFILFYGRCNPLLTANQLLTSNSGYRLPWLPWLPWLPCTPDTACLGGLVSPCLWGSSQHRTRCDGGNINRSLRKCRGMRALELHFISCIMCTVLSCLQRL